MSTDDHADDDNNDTDNKDTGGMTIVLQTFMFWQTKNVYLPIAIQKLLFFVYQPFTDVNFVLYLVPHQPPASK